MSHQFRHLTASSPIHRALVRNLVERHQEKLAVERVDLPESAIPVEERVMLRAFSDELHKVAFTGAVMPTLRALGTAARAGLPWAIGGELLYEGVDRTVNPNAEHRNVFQIAKDVGMSTLLHAPVAVGLQKLDKLRRVAPAGSWRRWLSEKSYGPLSFFGSFFDPKAQAIFKGVQPVIEKAIGGKPDDPSKMTPAQQASAQAASNQDLSPSYLELRKMDPRAVSARYLS